MSRSQSTRDRLCRQLGYTFQLPTLLDQALTHRSAGGADNERLEFLGDAILNLVIAEALFERYPKAPEGDLTRMRASLVREATLAEIARELELGECVALGPGELKSGGFRRDSILADALEAIMGAIARDSNLAAAREVILALYQQRLAEVPSARVLKDPKTRLQEWLQARQRPLPAYDVVSVTGEGHSQHFVVRCRVDDDTAATGEGSSRRRAEQAAAQCVFENLQ